MRHRGNGGFGRRFRVCGTMRGMMRHDRGIGRHRDQSFGRQS
jgi:hypothetical protein